MQVVKKYYDPFGTLHVEHQDRMNADLAFSSIQNLTPIIKENRELANHHNVRAKAQQMVPKGVDVLSVWSIPRTVVDNIMQQFNISEDAAINRIKADPHTFSDFKIG